MVDLDALVGELVERFDPDHGAASGPRLIRVVRTSGTTGEPDGERVEVAPGCESLLGWVAPESDRAVGVVAPGRAWFEQDGCRGRRGPRNASLVEPVTVAVVVARDGTVAARVRLPGRPPIVRVPDGGRLFDSLRRCVGLPTGPPPAGAAVRLHLALWLDGVRAEAEQGGRPPSWQEIVAQHPAGAALARLVPGVAVEDVVLATGWAAARTDWEDLRRRTVAGPLAGQLAPADLAGWMDAGMFARWVIDELPDPAGVVDRIRPPLPSSTARRVVRVVAACG